MIGVAVAVAGSLGAVTRYSLDSAARARWAGRVPWPTMVINVTGSLLLGVLSGLALFRHAPSSFVLVMGTGFCGGYTTFSAVSFETVRLIQRGAYRLAAEIGFGTLVLSVSAGALGLVVSGLG